MAPEGAVIEMWDFFVLLLLQEENHEQVTCFCLAVRPVENLDKCPFHIVSYREIEYKCLSIKVKMHNALVNKNKTTSWNENVMLIYFADKFSKNNMI